MISRMSAALLASLAAAGMAAGPASAEDFYAGKTVSIMVPTGLGSSMGLYGRMLAAALTKHIPGNPNVIVVSRPGAGGVTGTSYTYNAGPSDGTYIGMLSSGNIVLPMLREGVKYDVTKMQWIGSVAVRPSVLYLWKDRGVTSIEQAKTQEVILGSTGQGSGMSLWPRLLNTVVGTRFKVIEGYKGGADVDLAVEQGELHGRWTSYTALTAAKPHYIDDGLVSIAVQFGPLIERHRDTPNVKSFASGDDLAVIRFMELSESVGLGFWVRPEVPKERVMTLRAAMNAATADPAVRAEGAERGAPVEPLTGEQIEALVEEAYSLTPSQVARLHAIFGRQ